MPANLARRGYPSAYGNSEGLPLSTPGSTMRPGRGLDWMHAPLIPDKTEAYTQGPPGAVRSTWTAGDPKNFDVMYHAKSAGTSASGAGRFRLANYHSAASTNSSNGLAASTNYNGLAASTNYSNDPAYEQSSSSGSHSQGYSGQS
ncbi:hypothetical protein NW767_015217 [Fusarium falciforme]|nr:hypothetical protein NW767_015217 [Fusarium falciforme]